MSSIVLAVTHEHCRHKSLADSAMAVLDDADFFRRPAEHVNPIALIVKHLGGNLRSRWSQFLTTDGEKPDRDRDSEFALTSQDTRAHLLIGWEKGWQTALDTLTTLTDADLGRTVLIRGEPHTVLQALLRGATHVAYHTGQVLYLSRWLRPQSQWLTVAPGQSQGHAGNYLK